MRSVCKGCKYNSFRLSAGFHAKGIFKFASAFTSAVIRKVVPPEEEDQDLYNTTIPVWNTFYNVSTRPRLPLEKNVT